MNGSEIANELVKRVVERGSTLNHFTEYIQDVADPGKLVIYDWRDDHFTPENSNYGIVRPITKLHNIIDLEIPANTSDVTVQNIREGLMIQAGANSQQAFPILLPVLGSSNLGLNDFKLVDEQYIYKYNTTIETVSHTYTSKVFQITPWYDSSGERKTKKTYVGEETHTFSYTYSREEKIATGLKKGTNPYCLDKVDSALDKVNRMRSSLGADQNRLEHAMTVDSIAKENQEAAESKIRDADISSEYITYIKEDILSQFAQAMLAQSSQNQQQILELLQ